MLSHNLFPIIIKEHLLTYVNIYIFKKQMQFVTISIGRGVSNAYGQSEGQLSSSGPAKVIEICFSNAVAPRKGMK